jgi:uncharacterized protein
MRPKLGISILLLVAVFLFVVFASEKKACASSQPLRLTFGASGMGSAPYIFGAAVVEAMKKGLPAGSSMMISSGGGYENLARLESGGIEMAHQTTITLFAGLKGDEPFKSVLKNARLLSGITPPDQNEFHFIMSKDVPINTYAEIREKKYPLNLVTRTVGVAGEIMTSSIFRLNGFSYDDIKKWGGKVIFAAYPTGFELLKDGRVEAFGCSHTYPSALMTDLLKDRGEKLKWLSVDDPSVLAKLEELGMFKAVFTKGHYGPAFDKEIVSICAPEVLVVNADVPDGVVYVAVKAMCENADLIRASHASVKSFSPENAYNWLVRFKKHIPLHPGAERYFKEMGFMK